MGVEDQERFNRDPRGGEQADGFSKATTHQGVDANKKEQAGQPGGGPQAPVARAKEIDESFLQEGKGQSGAGFGEMTQGLQIAALHVPQTVELIAEEKRIAHISQAQPGSENPEADKQNPRPRGLRSLDRGLSGCVLLGSDHGSQSR